MGDDSANNAAAEAYKILGRNTAAGKALYNLYHKGETKEIGNKFHDQNAVRHQQKIASGWVPTKPERKLPVVNKPKVAVPHFTGRQPFSEEDAAQYRMMCLPRRRPVEVIRREIEEEYERMRNSPMPAPTRAVLDDAEKDRLANLMRYRGKPPTAADGSALGGPMVSSLRGARRPRAKPKNRLVELDELFEAVIGEIDERRAFLKHLEGGGTLKQEVLQSVNREIRDRVVELEKLDAMIKHEQATGAE